MSTLLIVVIVNSLHCERDTFSRFVITTFFFFCQTNLNSLCSSDNLLF